MKISWSLWWRKNFWDLINILLLIALFWQLSSHYASPSLLTILSEEDPPRTLHAPQAVEKNLLLNIEKIGAPVNTEDIIRELHRNPNMLKANPSLRNHIEQMQKTQNQLLQSEERLLALEKELSQLSLEMLEQLTEEQKNRLLENRNRDSVQKLEQKYWQELIQGIKKP